MDKTYNNSNNITSKNPTNIVDLHKARKSKSKGHPATEFDRPWFVTLFSHSEEKGVVRRTLNFPNVDSAQTYLNDIAFDESKAPFCVFFEPCRGEHYAETVGAKVSLKGLTRKDGGKHG